MSCEMAVERAHIRDYLFQGCDIFGSWVEHGTGTVTPGIKKYGTTDWVTLEGPFPDIMANA